MSIQTLYTAATGMMAMETKLDVIAHNLANLETNGFKRNRPNFEDLFYRHEKYPGTLDAAGNPTAVGTSIGLGAKTSSIQSEFRQGAFQHTKRDLDVAIEGDGFFQVEDPSGEILYTRAGHFSLNAEGTLVMGSADTGRIVQPSISIPADATNISISSAGEVRYRQPGTPTLQSADSVEMARFVNPEGLLKLGENMFAETDASGPAIPGTAGQDGIGTVHQGYLEASNVEPVRELIDLITAQRAFELNSQAVRVGDEILELVANLRR